MFNSDQSAEQNVYQLFRFLLEGKRFKGLNSCTFRFAVHHFTFYIIRYIRLIVDAVDYPDYKPMQSDL